MRHAPADAAMTRRNGRNRPARIALLPVEGNRGGKNGISFLVRRGFYSREVPATTGIFAAGASRRSAPSSVGKPTAAEPEWHRQIGGLAEQAVEIDARDVVHLFRHHIHRIEIVREHDAGLGLE